MLDTTASDIIEFYREQHPYQVQRKRLYDLFYGLSLAGGKELAAYAINLLDDPERNRDAESILKFLSCFMDGALDEWHSKLLDRELFNLPYLYRGANQAHAERLIGDLKSLDNTANIKYVDRRLQILAWMGGPVVERQFSAWLKSPPAWQKNLYIPAADYAQEAGWVLTKDGHRHDRFLRSSYRLVESTGSPAKSPVTVMTKSDAVCQWCQQPMYVLFDFDLTSPVLGFMELDGGQLRIATCLGCSCFGLIFTNVDLFGEFAWCADNSKPEHLRVFPSEDWPENRMTLGNLRRTPFECLPGSGAYSPSQIGGHPSWWQDAEYVPCPKCHEPMMCIAQIEGSDVYGEPAEGTYYALLCKGCGKALVHYQQS